MGTLVVTAVDGELALARYLSRQALRRNGSWRMKSGAFGKDLRNFGDLS